VVSSPRVVFESGAGCLFDFLASEADAGVSWSAAHCVSADLHMKKGIAPLFLKRFGGLAQMKAQAVGVSACAWTRNDKDYGGSPAAVRPLIFALVTKSSFFEKPTYSTLAGSLRACRDLMIAQGGSRLVFPALGCGLDGLDWLPREGATCVRDVINEVFAERTPVGADVWTLRLMAPESSPQAPAPAVPESSSDNHVKGIFTYYSK
jgi:hypothetical protein